MKIYETILKVPVLTEDIKEFTHRNQSDKYHPINIAAMIADEIRKHLSSNTKIQIDSAIQDYMGELVENIYDAYTKNGLKKGDSLIIKTVLKKEKGKYRVCIKDNAGGFHNKSKGEIFYPSNIKPEVKNKSFYLGGEGMGIFLFDLLLKRRSASLFFKNRNSCEGTTASIVFNNIPKL